MNQTIRVFSLIRFDNLHITYTTFEIVEQPASSSMAKRPKAPFHGERSSLIDLTACLLSLLIRWCQHSLCLQQRRSAWTNSVKHKESKEYSTEFLDSDQVSGKVLKVCGRMPQRGQKLVFSCIFWTCFSCFLFFFWFCYHRNQATTVLESIDMWNAVKSKPG